MHKIARLLPLAGSERLATTVQISRPRKRGWVLLLLLMTTATLVHLSLRVSYYLQRPTVTSVQVNRRRMERAPALFVCHINEAGKAPAQLQVDQMVFADRLREKRPRRPICHIHDYQFGVLRANCAVCFTPPQHSRFLSADSWPEGRLTVRATVTRSAAVGPGPSPGFETPLEQELHAVFASQSEARLLQRSGGLYSPDQSRFALAHGAGYEVKLSKRQVHFVSDGNCQESPRQHEVTCRVDCVRRALRQHCRVCDYAPEISSHLNYYHLLTGPLSLTRVESGGGKVLCEPRMIGCTNIDQFASPIISGCSANLTHLHDCQAVYTNYTAIINGPQCSGCKPACRKESITAKVSASQGDWANTETTENSASNYSTKERNSSLTEPPVTATVYMSFGFGAMDGYVVVQRYEFSNLSAYLTDIGGTLGVWAGGSLITICLSMEALGEMLWNKLNKLGHRKRTITTKAAQII